MGDRDYLIPATREEFERLGWDQADIILVSGDAYVDHPAFGVAVIARVLQAEGYRVGVIDQPDTSDPDSVALFGAPRLFFGVTAGNVDSMLSRYTAFHKVRNDDPFSPAGQPCPRPERASIVYTNMLNRRFKGVPVVLGGVEASMRRLLHFDFKTEKLRRSILADSRADILVYGMGEYAVREIARRMQQGQVLAGIPGTVIFQAEPPAEALQLPAEELGLADPEVYTEIFREHYINGDRIQAQPAGGRWLVQYPLHLLSEAEMDAVYDLPYTRLVHPRHAGVRIPAFEMIRDSVTSHRGCASGCAFCSLSLHQGRRVQSRSESSLLREVKRIAAGPAFHGHITDIGGPSANMYRSRCTSTRPCQRQSCLYPNRCRYLEVHTRDWLDILDKAEKQAGVRHVTVGSGVRYDLMMQDDPSQLSRLIPHISGNLKVAPESTDETVLRAMRKTPLYSFDRFMQDFRAAVQQQGRKFAVIPYLMSNHPGSTPAAMQRMKKRIRDLIGYDPRQVQSFIPLPMTLSSVMYYTGRDPFSGEELFCEPNPAARRRQHDIFFQKNSRLR